MSFLIGESSKSSISDSDSSRKSPFPSGRHNDSINSSDSTQTSCSPATKGQLTTIATNTTTTAENKSLKTKREVYRYETDWLVSAVAWLNNGGESFELAVGSFIEEYCNQIHIVNLARDSYDEEILLSTSFDHPYPPTKISWIPKAPESAGQLPRLLATSADYLRIWRAPPLSESNRCGNKLNQAFDNNFNNNNNNVTECDSTSEQDEQVRLECSLSPGENAKYRSPLTSFDWNEIDTRFIVTSSVDTTCAVWDVEIGAQLGSIEQIGSYPTSSNKISCQLKNQILAHDHEVYDVSFSRQGSGRDIFVTAGGDGSLRLFDLRVLSTSTVLYETNDKNNADNSRVGPALVRVACNKQDSNYVSTFATSSKDVILIDVRKAGKQMATLSSHGDSLNSISWAPHSAHHMCSASDDGQALIWGLQNMQDPASKPILAYRASGKINAINWSSSHPDWIAIGFEDCLELLRV